jgi:hypothetical protein
VTDKPEWVRALEAKYGLPAEDIPGTVYVLHYDPPQIVRSVSMDYAGLQAVAGKHGLESDGPISHYVGWTQQSDPRRRIYNHGPISRCEVVSLRPGTMRDEQREKLTGACPKCGAALRDSLSRDYLEYLGR